MNAKTHLLRILPCILIAACAPAVSLAQVIFQDTFENDTTTGTLNGRSTSDGNATYSVVNSSALFNKATVWTTPSGAPSYLGSYFGNAFANSGGSTWLTVSTDFDSTPAYTFEIGYLSLNGTGTFGIFVGSNTSTVTSGFTFSVSNSTTISVAYRDASGTSHSLGTITGTPSGRAAGEGYLTSVSITVIGNTQQLFINGVAYGSVIATEGTSGDSAADQIQLYAAGVGSAMDVRLDNLVATAIPEPAGFALVFGIGGLAMVASRRRRR